MAGGLLVVHGEEDKVGRGEPVRIGLLEGPAAELRQMRVHRGDRRPGIASRRDGP